MFFEDMAELREWFKDTKWYELRSYAELFDFSGHTIPVFGSDFFLDSGAFSAMKQGFDINCGNYGRFLAKHSDRIHMYANLDAIPTSQRKDEVARAAQVTLENQKKLEEMGLKPVPVYHR